MTQGGGAPKYDQGRVLPSVHRGPQLSHHLPGRDQSFLLRAEGVGKGGILNSQGGDARRFQLLHCPHDVNGVAVAVVGVHQQAQVAGAGYPTGLLDELRQGEDHQVGSPQDRGGGD